MIKRILLLLLTLSLLLTTSCVPGETPTTETPTSESTTTDTTELPPQKVIQLYCDEIEKYENWVYEMRENGQLTDAFLSTEMINDLGGFVSCWFENYSTIIYTFENHQTELRITDQFSSLQELVDFYCSFGKHATVIRSPKDIEDIDLSIPPSNRDIYYTLDYCNSFVHVNDDEAYIMWYQDGLSFMIYRYHGDTPVQSSDWLNRLMMLNTTEDAQKQLTQSILKATE